MHIRRQLLAAGLLLAVTLVAPLGPRPAVAPAQARAPFSSIPVDGAPAAQAVFLPFLAGGSTLDLAIAGVQVVQGVAQSPAYTVHIAGRPAMLRVFVTLDGADSVDGVSARVRHYVGGQPQGELAAPAQTILGTPSPGALAHTFNFILPASWLTSDSAYVVEVDHVNALAEIDETNNRYPAAGEQSFDFVPVPTLEVVIVPVRYKGVMPPLDDLRYLTWMPELVLPVANINYSVRATPYVFEGDLRTSTGWGELLAAIDDVRAAEDPSWNKAYYGLVDTMAVDGCSVGCYTGLGYVNTPTRTVYKTAIGFAGFLSNRQAASATYTHELGHNFGRRHAPCAGPRNVDPDYPYANAEIGQWGYDLSTGTLISPGNKDYMSYCGPEWTSDYTFHGIAQSWSWLNVNYARSASAAADRLVISGRFAPDGSLHVDPVFQAPAASMLASAAPTHRVDLLDAKGRVLASLPFELSEIILDVSQPEAGGDTYAQDESHSRQAASFRVLAPPVPGLAGLRVYAGSDLLYERLVNGALPEVTASAATLAGRADGSVEIALSASAPGLHYRVRFSPDGGATWHLLELASSTPVVDIPGILLEGATEPLLEIQASDGLRTSLEIVPLSVL